MKNIGIKTVGGVGVGVAVGYFAFQSKNPLVLMGLGVLGGAVVAYYVKTKSDEVKNSESKSLVRVEDIKSDIKSTFVKVDDSCSNNEEFNKEVGYITSCGTVDETNPNEMVDLNF